MLAQPATREIISALLVDSGGKDPLIERGCGRRARSSGPQRVARKATDRLLRSPCRGSCLGAVTGEQGSDRFHPREPLRKRRCDERHAGTRPAHHARNGGAPSNPVAYGVWMLDNVVAASVSALRGRVASCFDSSVFRARCCSRRPSERLRRRNPFMSTGTPNRPAGSQRLCSLVHRAHGRHVRATSASKCA
jgi:hypothetical protein